MKPQLVIFMKAPRYGTVKTRLAAEIGRGAAWRFYRNNLRSLMRHLRDPRWDLVLAVTPDDHVRTGGDLPADLPRWPQGRGDLGQRMGRAFEELSDGPMIIVGADIPGIKRRHIARAFRVLRSHDVTLGPTEDGGYWLIGLSRRRTIPGVFNAVRWSSGQELADTRANLTRYRVADVDTLVDVDVAADLFR